MPIDFPTTPDVGETYSFEGKTWVWNGTGWEAVLVRTFPLTVSDAEPSSPAEGDLWLDIS